MRNRGVVYFLMGSRHAVVAAVSAMTLREWWDGDVTFFAGDREGLHYSQRIAGACGAEVLEFEHPMYKRNSGYAIKPLLPSLSPYAKTIQIDADTLVVGKLDELWPQHGAEWRITRYADWVTTGNIVSGRIKKWLKHAPRLAAKKLEMPFPAVNTGVMGYGCRSEAAREAWPQMTARQPTIFISDETACDLIWTEYPNVVMLDDRFNWSPMHGVAKKDIRVVHCHGKKHVRRNEGLKVWWPRFSEAWEKNYAGIRDWCPAGDKYLQKHCKNDVVSDELGCKRCQGTLPKR